MMKPASELSRHELDELCSQYEKLLRGQMQRQQLVINSAWDYFNGIPEPSRTPEESALEELFSEIEDYSLEQQLDDLEMMRGNFETLELQNEFWFDFQHIIHIRACRLEMYARQAQKVAAQYGFELPSNLEIIPES